MGVNRQRETLNAIGNALICMGLFLLLIAVIVLLAAAFPFGGCNV